MTANSGLQQPTPVGTGVAQWNAEEYDTANLWNPAQPSRLTAPIAGIYLVTAGAIREQNNATDNATLTIRVSGIEYASEISAPVPGEFKIQAISTVAPLNAGDFVELTFAGQALDGFANAKRTHLSLTWLGPRS